MAYSENQLSRGNGFSSTDLSGFSQFFYRTNDTVAEIVTAGYFNEARDHLETGDAIWAMTALNQTNPESRIFTRIVMDAVPHSPSAVNVTVEAKKIVSS